MTADDILTTLKASMRSRQMIPLIGPGWQFVARPLRDGRIKGSVAIGDGEVTAEVESNGVDDDALAYMARSLARFIETRLSG